MVWRWFPLRKQFDGCGAGKLKRIDLCASAKSCKHSARHLLNSALQSVQAHFRISDQSSGRMTFYSFLLPCWNPAKWGSVSTDKASFREEVTEKAECQQWGLARESKSDNPDPSSRGPFHSYKLHFKAYSQQVLWQFQHRLLNVSAIWGLTCWCLNLFGLINKLINCSRLLWRQLVTP